MLTSPKDKSYGNKKQKVFIGKDSIYYIKNKTFNTFFLSGNLMHFIKCI